MSGALTRASSVTREHSTRRQPRNLRWLLAAR